jgi:hypothetical protein
MLNDRGKALAVLIAEAFDDCLGALEAVCPSGREFSIVRTRLEEACFFAKKAIATQPQNAIEI